MKHRFGLIGLIVAAVVLIGASFYPQLGRVLGFREALDTPEEKQVTLVAVGDVMLGRSVNTTMLRKKDWTHPFIETAVRLSQADITFGNLESPFGQDCPATNEGMVFCADKRSIAGLELAGFDVLSLENNHNQNQGQTGLDLTEDWLESHLIAGVFEEEVELIDRNGLTIAFLAFDDVSRRVDRELAQRDLVRASGVVDIVVVSVHWGWEYRAEPNSNQVELGRWFIDQGAHLVLGHHPHWRQTVEEYKNGVIFYSLGNFVFDQMWSEETRLGDVATISLDETGVIDYRLDQVRIYEYAQPRWVE